MALSMDEQRMLAEIERRLSAEDPGLAARLSSFRRPSRVNLFQSARARVVGSLLTVMVVAMVSLVVYAMLPFRPNSVRPLGGHPEASHGLPTMTVSSAGPGGKAATGKATGAKTARAKARPSAAARASARSASRPSPVARSGSVPGRAAGSTATSAVHGP